MKIYAVVLLVLVGACCAEAAVEVNDKDISGPVPAPKAGLRTIIGSKTPRDTCYVKFSKYLPYCDAQDTSNFKCDVKKCTYVTYSAYDMCGKPVTLWKPYVKYSAVSCRKEGDYCSFLNRQCECTSRFCWAKIGKQYFKLCNKWYYEDVKVLFPCGCDCRKHYYKLPGHGLHA